MSTVTNTHYNAQFGTTLKNSRYTILRKLGDGITAVTWLVRDSEARPSKYLAAKILSVEATSEPGPIRERDFLKTITERGEGGEDNEGFDYLPTLSDSFTICINKTLPVYMVRNIIHMTLHALRVLHNLSIVHTDVKLDNILFTNARFSLYTKLEKYLEDIPSKMNPETGLPESQPIPHEWTFETNAHEAERMSVVLMDLGHAEWADKEPLGEGFCPLSLRPPGVLLESGFGTAIDIWAVGCLTFELMVGRWLFTREDGGEDWSMQEDHLAKMMELTGQTFPKSVLDRAKNRDKYFDKDGSLLHIPELIPVSIEEAMRNYNIPGLSEEDISQGSDFIRACLHLDHEQRLTAKDLLGHSFLDKAFIC